MSSHSRHDAVIASWLRDGPTGMTAADRSAIADAAEQVAQRRSLIPHWAGQSMFGRRALVLLVAALALVLGTTVLLGFGYPLVTDEPTPTAIVWTHDSINHPYPAPLRSEPLFRAPLADAELAPDIDLGDPEEGVPRVFRDAPGDTSPAPVGQIDLLALEFTSLGCWRDDSFCLRYHTVAGLTRPFPNPVPDEWIVYGVVFDNDGDGRADVRFGVDNQPGDTLRAWSTDLRTGETEFRIGVWPDHPRLWEVELPMADREDETLNRGYVNLLPDLTTPKGYFYVWSAVIRDDQIVAMDFAPDVGWLDSRPGDDESKWRGRP